MAVALEREKAAQEEREKALNRERVALRRGRRALAGMAGLFVCIIVGAIGWYNQHFLKDQYCFRVVMRASVLTTGQERILLSKQEFKGCANGCPTMVVVPAGTFMMGPPESEQDRSENQGPQHTVSIAKPFAVSKFDVTFDEWDQCTACPSHRRESHAHYIAQFLRIRLTALPDSCRDSNPPTI
jgi:formylglycine-generating enzyme required for sulfatase activity